LFWVIDQNYGDKGVGWKMDHTSEDASVFFKDKPFYLVALILRESTSSEDYGP
jgi:hypothetical protein